MPPPGPYGAVVEPTYAPAIPPIIEEEPDVSMTIARGGGGGLVAPPAAALTAYPHLSSSRLARPESSSRLARPESSSRLARDDDGAMMPRVAAGLPPGGGGGAESAVDHHEHGHSHDNHGDSPSKGSNDWIAATLVSHVQQHQHQQHNNAAVAGGGGGGIDGGAAPAMHELPSMPIPPDGPAAAAGGPFAVAAAGRRFVEDLPAGGMAKGV